VVSFAVKVTDVRPVALAVNVAAPVPVLAAVIVTLCGVEKLAGVNVSEPPAVTDKPLFPEVRLVVTVTFPEGAADSEIPTVPVVPWVMFCVVGLTARLTVPPAVVSVAVKVTDVKPVALTVNVAAPVPEELAAMVTFWAVAKFDGVNVSDPPEDTDRPLFPEVNAVLTVTFAVGAEDSEIPTVPVPPWAMFCDVELTMRVPEPELWPVHWTPLRVNTVGDVFVPL
jgi:hypothetical protein